MKKDIDPISRSTCPPRTHCPSIFNARCISPACRKIGVMNLKKGLGQALGRGGANYVPIPLIRFSTTKAPETAYIFNSAERSGWVGCVVGTRNRKGKRNVGHNLHTRRPSCSQRDQLYLRRSNHRVDKRFESKLKARPCIRIVRPFLPHVQNKSSPVRPLLGSSSPSRR